MLTLGAESTIVFTISFIAYTLAIVAIGLYSARFARRSDEDYFLAGRSLGPWVAALSASASSESGWVTLGLVGWAFTTGAQVYWIIPGCVVGFLFNWFVLAKRVRQQSAELQALTIPDLFARRFNERLPLLRILSVIVILVAMLLYVAAQFAAAGKAFDASFASVEYRGGVFIGAGVVLIYTILGGFRAACWTDFVQGLIMVGTLVAFPIYMLSLADVGGFAGLTDQLTRPDLANGTFMEFMPQRPEGVEGASFVAWFLGFLLGSSALGINFGYPGQPHVLVRFMALRDDRAAKIGGWVSVTWGILVLWGAVTVGIIVRAMHESGAEWTSNIGDGERGLVLAAINLAPGMVSGLILAAVLAAICSTADSQLVVAASSAANDIYVKLIKRSGANAHTLINRLVMLTLGVIAVAMVLNQDINVYQYVLTYGWAIMGASFGPQIILMTMWKRASYAGCLAGMLTGFIVALAWPTIWSQFAASADIHIYNLPLAFLCAMVVNLGVSLAVPGDK